MSIEAREIGFEYRWQPKKEQVLGAMFNEEILSPVFATVSNGLRYHWKLMLFPKGEKTSQYPSGRQQPFISIYLLLVEGGLENKLEGRVELFLLNKVQKKAEVGVQTVFSIDHPGWGFPDFFEQTELKEVNSFIFGVKLWIKETWFQIEELLPTKELKEITKNVSLYRLTVLRDISKGTASGDFTLISQEGEELPCHQYLLQESSPVFEAMFQPHTAEFQSRRASIEDISTETLQQLLCFFYTNSFPEGWETGAKELLLAANKYQVVELVSVCEKQVAKQLSGESAVEMLKMGVALELPLLKTLTTQWFLDNWADLSLEAKKQLMAEELMLVVMDAFDAAIALPL